MKKKQSKQPSTQMRYKGKVVDKPIKRTPKRSKSLSHGDILAPPSQNFQLVPFRNWSVVLYRKSTGQVVLYNNQANQFRVEQNYAHEDSRRSSPLVDEPGGEFVDPADNHSLVLNNNGTSALFCPTCGRPFDGPPTASDRYTKSWESTGETFSDNYFKVLNHAFREESRRNRLEYIPPARTPLTRVSSGILSRSSSFESISQLKPRDSDEIKKDIDNALSSEALNQGYYNKFFIEKNKLGKGLRGSVFLCQHVLEGVSLGEYAIKKVAVGDNRLWLQKMLKEVTLLETLRHPNIIEYKHSWLETNSFSKFGPKVPCLYILMERANGGNLEEYMGSQNTQDIRSEKDSKFAKLQRRLGKDKGIDVSSFQQANKLGSWPIPPKKHYLTEREIWGFFSDICSGLAHLHDHGIIHRDLKPQNLLLNYPNSNESGGKSGDPRLLLTDFGECEVISHLEKRERTGATGTLEFMAPELIRVDEGGHFLDTFSTKADMWSLGMVLYYLCYSGLPFTNVDEIDILKRQLLDMKSVTFPKTDRDGAGEIPKQLKWLMQVLLNPDETKRPDVHSILDFVLEHQQAVCGTTHPGIRVDPSDNESFAHSEALESATSHRQNKGMKRESALSEIKSTETQLQIQPSKNYISYKGAIPIRKAFSEPESRWVVPYSEASPQCTSNNKLDNEKPVRGGEQPSSERLTKGSSTRSFHTTTEASPFSFNSAAKAAIVALKILVPHLYCKPRSISTNLLVITLLSCVFDLRK